MRRSAENPGGLSAFDHSDLWHAIDTLAAEHGLTASGLAREAGLDATAFNPSKRHRAGLAPRWPTLETLARILGATGTSLESFALLVAGARVLPNAGMGAPHPANASAGRVPMLPFERLAEPGLFDADGHPQGATWQDIELPSPAPPGCYVVRLDAGLEPVWRARSLLVVEPEALLRPEDRAVHFDTLGVHLVEVIDPHRRVFLPLGFGNAGGGSTKEGVFTLRLHRISWASQ